MKKLLCAVLIFVLCICQCAFAFSDMPDDTVLRPALENAVKNGLLSGYDGKIMPNDPLTRGQMAAIMSRALGANKKADISSYVDVKESDWFFDDMAKAVYMGAFKGDGDRLNPEGFITREEAFVVISRIFAITKGENASLKSLADFSEISSWANDSISGMMRDKYIEASDGKIEPKRNMTRAEFAVIMDKIAPNYITEEGTYESLPGTNVIIKANNVVLKGIKTDKNIIIADGVGDDGIKMTDMDVSGSIVVRGGGKKVYMRGNFNEINIAVPNLDVDAMDSSIESVNIVRDSNIYIGSRQ